jgi:hypothetical protein
MEWFNVNQLTKEMVSARLSELTDPVDAAVEILEKTVAVALKDVDRLKPGHRQTIVAACQGTLTALLLKQHNLRTASVKVLHAMVRTASAMHQDPTELSTLALHAVADLRRFVARREIDGIRAAIDAEFMGAGDMLRSLVDKAAAEDQNAASQSLPS